MKREYVAPDFYSEEFVLSQHVAKGCGSSTHVVPGGSISGVYIGCEQCFDNNGDVKKNPGQGHWLASDVTVYDSNGNGEVDWDEIVAACGSALNGVVTGGGHNGHSIAVRFPDKTVEIVTPLNS